MYTCNRLAPGLAMVSLLVAGASVAMAQGCKRLMNVLDVTDRISLDGRREGQRRYRVGFIAAGTTFQGSSASTSASVVACGRPEKMWRRYAKGSMPAALQVSMML